MTHTSDQILRLENLSKVFSVTNNRGFGSTRLTAVNNVSFSIGRGETFGLVGESGCGKSTLSKIALRLVEATSGAVYFEDRNLYGMSFRQLQALRREMQVVFQDPYDSLNPRLTLEEIVAEPLKIHRFGDRAQRSARIDELFEAVSLPVQWRKRYAHQLSGGQRQRLCIARALALSPKFIVCDEAVSALDVSIQAQILNLLLELQESLHLTYLVITHDLGVIRYVSDRIAVMYLGKIMEYGPVREVLTKPLHPYTKGLLDTSPVLDPSERNREKQLMNGDIGSLIDLPEGCRFAPRCPFAEDRCRREEPESVEKTDLHGVACHLAG